MELISISQDFVIKQVENKVSITFKHLMLNPG